MQKSSKTAGARAVPGVKVVLGKSEDHMGQEATAFDHATSTHHATQAEEASIGAL